MTVEAAEMNTQQFMRPSLGECVVRVTHGVSWTWCVLIGVSKATFHVPVRPLGGSCLQLMQR